jgi:Na+/H+ antiporter NhaD/arsenite permease-like protein
MAFYWATCMLSALFDNAPTYLGFFVAALGFHALDINDSSHVAR